MPLHPVCHRAIHSAASASDLARLYPKIESIRAHPQVARFLAWVANKPADFHAPPR